jgi:hypothetical protein
VNEHKSRRTHWLVSNDAKVLPCGAKTRGSRKTVFRADVTCFKCREAIEAAVQTDVQRTKELTR